MPILVFDSPKDEAEVNTNLPGSKGASVENIPELTDTAVMEAQLGEKIEPAKRLVFDNPTVPEAPQPEGNGFIDRLAKDYQNRIDQVSQVRQDVSDGKINPVAGTIGFFGKGVAGPLADVNTEAFKSAENYAKDLFSQKTGSMIFDPIAEAINKPKEPSAPGSLSARAAAVLGKMGSAYDSAVKDRPNTKLVLESLGNAALAVPTLEAAAPLINKTVVPAVKNTAEGVVSGAKTIGAGVTARGADALDETANALKEKSSVLYQQMRDVNGYIVPKKGVNIANTIENAVRSSGKLNDRLHGDTLSVLSDIRTAAKSGAMGLEELDQYRQLLNDAVRKNTDALGKVNPDGMKALAGIDALDNAVESLGTIDFLGGKAEGAQLLGEARKQWAKYRKFDSVANIIKKADGDPNLLKSGFKRFVNNPKNMKGFTPEERAVLKAAASNSFDEQLLKAFGKFGFDLGTSLTPGNTFLPALGSVGAGAGLGTAPLVAGGTVARQGQKIMARGKAEKALRKIEER